LNQLSWYYKQVNISLYSHQLSPKNQYTKASTKTLQSKNTADTNSSLASKDLVIFSIIAKYGISSKLRIAEVK